MKWYLARWTRAAGFQVADEQPLWLARCGGVAARLPVAGTNDGESELFRSLVMSAVRAGAKTTVVGVTMGWHDEGQRPDSRSPQRLVSGRVGCDWRQPPPSRSTGGRPSGARPSAPRALPTPAAGCVPRSPAAIPLRDLPAAVPPAARPRAIWPLAPPLAAGHVRNNPAGQVLLEPCLLDPPAPGQPRTIRRQPGRVR